MPVRLRSFRFRRRVDWLVEANVSERRAVFMFLKLQPLDQVRILFVNSSECCIHQLQLRKIERCGRMVSTPALYSGVSGFKPRNRDQLFGSLRDFTQSPKIREQCFKLVHESFRPRFSS